MVNGALTIGGVVGVGLSAAFLYFEVGRFAAPQVPQSYFDERREFFAYTAGLFLGIALVAPWLFLLTAAAGGAFASAIIDIAIIVVGTEAVQWFLLRTRYFGSDRAGAFYALGLRSGMSAIFILGLVADYLGGSTITTEGVGIMVLACIALLGLEVASGLLSVTRSPTRPAARGSPVRGGLIGALGLFLVSLGWATGGIFGIVALAIALVGTFVLYARVRDALLAGAGPHRGPAEVSGPTQFGRQTEPLEDETDRGPR
jgi:hypothetical protein